MEEAGANALLRQLHGAANLGDVPERDTIFLMDRDQGVRQVLQRVLAKNFPDFRIEAVANVDEAIGALTGEIGERIALAIFEIDDTGQNERTLDTFRQGSSHTNFSGVPLVALSDLVFEIRSHFGIDEERLGRLGIDGILDKLNMARDIEIVLAEAITKRSELFAEIEETKRKEIIQDFLRNYLSLVKAWQQSVQDVSFYPTDREDEVKKESPEDDLVTVLIAIRELETVLQRLEIAGVDAEAEVISKVAHDIGNKLAVILSFLTLLREGENMGKSDARILEILHSEIKTFHAYKTAIDEARLGRSTWSSIAKRELIARPDQHLECPKGMVFCVIDDSQSVLDVAKREIEKAGGVAYTARNAEELAELMEGPGASMVQVVLLDNDLGRFSTGSPLPIYGNTLVDQIRGCFTNAIVIGHTSEAVEINLKGENNPYKKLGVEVVGKREWSAVSRIIENNLK